MNIAVKCPQCENTYLVEPGLRGKRMRCPNPICRAIFEVPGAESAEGSKPVSTTPAIPAAPPKPALQSVAPPPISEPPAPSWQQALPLRGDMIVPATVVAVEFPDNEGFTAEPPVRQPAGPRELSAGTWDAPPVRVSLPEAPAATAAEPAAEEVKYEAPLPVSHIRRRILTVLLAMVALLIGGAGLGYFVIQRGVRGNEVERYKDALDHYEKQDFSEASARMHKLAQDYPKSDLRHDYDFLTELSDVRRAVYAKTDSPEELQNTYSRVKDFLKFNNGDPLLEKYRADVWHSLAQLTRDETDQAAQRQDPTLLTTAQRYWDEAEAVAPKGVSKSEIERGLRADWQKLSVAMESKIRHLEALETMNKFLQYPSAKSVQEAREFVDAGQLSDDTDIKPLLDKLVTAHRATVTFESADDTNLSSTAASDSPPSIYFTPSLASTGSGPAGETVFAIAHGVLYALDPRDGSVHWLMRVGIDATALPVRVPASLALPELAIVVSTDDNTVSAVEADSGKLVWRRRLTVACLGQPVLVDHHLLIPTRYGRVEEVEVYGGRLQGEYHLGQPLLAGGVHQPGTSIVYFPADQYCIYALDVAERTCSAILYTKHPAGSIRVLPTILPDYTPAGLSPSGWLLVAQTEGRDEVRIHPYSLPISQPDQKPEDLGLKTLGHLWFRPWSDGQRLALVTDAGNLALYGIRQPGNGEPLLFPILGDDYVVDTVQGERARAQIVYADHSDIWVLAHDHLHCLETNFTAAKGPGIIERWRKTPLLGSPVLPAQIREGPDGRKTLFTVTLSTATPAIVATALEADSGQILWQRQLGFCNRDEPAVVGGRLFIHDTTGLVRIDPPAKEAPWLAVGKTVLPDRPGDDGVLLSDGAQAVYVTWAPSQKQVIRLRTLTEDKSREYTMQSPMQGTPCLVKGAVIVPMANGVLARLGLDGGSITIGQDWRAAGATEQTSCYLIPLPDGDCLFTDGAQGIYRLGWHDATLGDKKSAGQVMGRIISRPVVLSPTGSAYISVAVADAANGVTLLDGNNLRVGRRWSLSGRITAGPFVRGSCLCCIVGKDKLVSFDPASDAPTWEVPFRADIVGEPQLIEDVLVVADLGGHITGIDPKTGETSGEVYDLKPLVAPTSAPQPFGEGSCLVPLSDGTAMVLSMVNFKAK